MRIVGTAKKSRGSLVYLKSDLSSFKNEWYYYLAKNHENEKPWNSSNEVKYFVWTIIVEENKPGKV